MRPIKFRGLSEDGVWYFGYYEKYNLRHRITNEELYGNKIYFVDGKTIGQFTGLIDKNGKEIYYGDIVRRQTLIKKTNKEGFNYTEWEDRNFQVIWHNQSYYPNNLEESEIIGNIYDNPDLLTNNQNLKRLD